MTTAKGISLEFDTHGNEKQKDCCRKWADQTTTDIVYGGAKGGAKSFTGCKLTFSSALIYPGTHWFIARNKLTDIMRFTIPSIHEVFQDWKINIADYTKFNGQYNFFECRNKSKVFLLDAAHMPSDPLYMRFGSMQFTGGWGEEVGEWEEAAKTNLQASIGRWKNDTYGLPPKFLQTCNPSKNYLYREYYKPFKSGTLKHWQAFIQALPSDNKMLPAGYIEQLERTLNKAEKERLLHGNWEFDDDPSALIEYEKILDIFTNNHIPEGERFITCDIARLGGDKIVIIEWTGWRGRIKYYTKQTLDITTTYIQSAMLRNQTGNSNTLVDSDGMGGGPVDMLRVKGFTNNARALPAPNGQRDAKGNEIIENFDNLKSQCYFRLAERINKNGIYLECETDEIKNWVIEELEQVKQKLLDSDMKKGVIPKDKVKEVLGRSPDFADTIMMREYFELKPSFKFNDAEY